MESISSAKTAVGRFFEGIGRGIRRFSVPFGFALAITLIRLLCDLDAEFLSLDPEPFSLCAWLTLGTGMALSAALQLLFESKPVRLMKLWEVLISVPVSLVLLVLTYLSTKGKLSAPWDTFSMMLTAGIALASVFTGLSAVSARGGDGSGVRAAVFGAFWGGLLFSIVSSAFLLFYFAINTLIVSLPEELILTIIAFSTMCVGLMVFLSFLPAPGEERPRVKAYTVLFTYVLTPLFLVFLLILYAYILRIAIRWEMPSGEMNPYGMFALGIFTLLWLILRGEEAPFAKWFSRFGGLFVLPVTAVQILGLAIRIRAYGLTPLRVASVALVLLGLTGVVWSLVKAPLRVYFLIAAGISLLMLASPVNVIQIANLDQEVRLKKVLTRYSMILPDGSLSLSSAQPSEEDRAKIDSGFSYFRYADGFLSPFAKTVRAEARNYSEVQVPDAEYHSCSFVQDRTLPMTVPAGAKAYYLGDLFYETGSACPFWTDPETFETVTIDLGPLVRKLAGTPPFAEDAWDVPEDLSFSADDGVTVWISEISIRASAAGGEISCRADAYDCWIIVSGEQ